MPDLVVTNPARPSEVVGSLPLADAVTLATAVSVGANAAPAWAALTLEDRVTQLQAALAAVAPRYPELAELLIRENGKTRRDAVADVAGLAGMLAITRPFLDVLADRVYAEENRPFVLRRRAHGLATVIVPFNAPVTLAAAHLMPALVAGNTALVKAPLQCPLTLVALLNDVAAHLPPGVVQVVVASDTDVSEVVIGNPRVRKVGFTGSTRGALSVLRAFQDIKSVTYELGGNDAAIVLDDAAIDSQMAAQLTAGALSINGQYCSAVKRVYVQRSRYEEFVECLDAEYSRLVVGDGLRDDVTLGPVIDAAAQARAVDLVSRARSQGATVLERGTVPDQELFDAGYFVRPTLVLGPDQKSGIVQEEQFAPVLPVLAFDTDDEAVALANDSVYGLGGSVWGTDLARAEAVADRLEVGVAIVNGTPNDTKDPRVPFGGVKQSGIGRVLSTQGLEAYTTSFGRYSAPRAGDS